MRNPFRPVLNLSWAAIAAVVLAPVVFVPAPAYARGGGGGGGGGRGSNAGGGSRGSANANGKNKNGQNGKNSQVKNAGEYLLVLQQQDALDGRAEFIFQAREDATQDARDKDRAAALAANREKESQQLRADDMPRP